MIKVLEKNTKGKDYFVGDVHGCYRTLFDKLNAIHFDKKVDRLISVGDLIDRGPSSKECLELLSEPWFYAVIGNHEDMMLGCYNGTWNTANYIRNGGDWFFGLSKEDQSQVVNLALEMPLLIEVQVGDKKIGVVHADFLEKEWGCKFSGDDGSWEFNKFRENAIWGRKRVYEKYSAIVKNVDLIVCGHTPLKSVTKIANLLYIDTGAVYGGGLTILSEDQVLEYCKDE